MNDRELDLLVDKEDPVRQLVNHNVQGFKTLYFVIQKQGNIGMVRSFIERQLKIGRMMKGLNFTRDEDNEVTEILTLTNTHKR